MSENDEKKINHIVENQKNNVIVSTALGLQGIILIVSGILLGMLNSFFHWQLSGVTLIGLRIAFVISGVVDISMAMYFYRKSRIFVD
jgi:uncharacterized membrane-anchored protein